MLSHFSAPQGTHSSWNCETERKKEKASSFPSHLSPLLNHMFLPLILDVQNFSMPRSSFPAQQPSFTPCLSECCCEHQHASPQPTPTQHSGESNTVLQAFPNANRAAPSSAKKIKSANPSNLRVSCWAGFSYRAFPFRALKVSWVSFSWITSLCFAHLSDAGRYPAHQLPLHS